MIIFYMKNDYCTAPHGQKLIKSGLVLGLASFRGRGNNLLKEIEAQASVQGNTVCYDALTIHCGTLILVEERQSNTFVKDTMLYMLGAKHRFAQSMDCAG